MSYQIRISKRAIKTLEKISEPYYSNIKKVIYSLKENPRPQGVKKLKGRNALRIRVANYRIIYQIFDNIMTIEIIDLGHRKDIYQ